MTNYFEITSDQAYPAGHTLVAKQVDPTEGFNDGILRKIIIANHHATSKNTIQLFLDDGAGSPTRHTIVKTIIPAQSTLVLQDGITFNALYYDLKISTDDSGGSTAITVIIK